MVIRFLDAIKRETGARNDAQLAALLGVHQAIICNMRKSGKPPGDSFLAKVSRATNKPVKDLDCLAADGV